MSYVCSCCQRSFGNSRGLTQHQQRNASCKATIGQAHGAINASAGCLTANNQLATVSTNAWRLRLAEALLAENQASLSSSSRAHRPEEASERPSQRPRLELNIAAHQCDSDHQHADMLFENDNDDSAESDASSVDVELQQVLPDKSMLNDFKNYCKESTSLVGFSHDITKAIKLMSTLRKTKASLSTYDDVMVWHLKASGVLHDHETGRTNSQFISRNKLFEHLRKRCNRDKKWNQVSKLTLPSSKAAVNIVWTDAKDVITSLLTDPRIKDSDYLFFEDDPFAPPPDLNYVGDLNTGKAYLETYNKLITKPGKQVLLPTPLYVDGAVTGQFSDLPIAAVKIALGIFSRKARDNPHFWGTLGCMPPISKDKSRGLRLFIDSGHLDATRAVHEAEVNEGLLDGKEAHKAQDFHSMLAKVLESYINLQSTGFIWDLFYKGKLYKDIEFIPFVPFIKCDTDEADVLCGKYKSRGKNVANLCRYCTCPTDESDDPSANYPAKRSDKIQRLVDKKDLQALKNMSQQCINNATYKLRFGLHNKCGVHGATPLEMLHAMLLGVFKYVRDIFFTQTGKTSQVSAEIDALAKEMGHLLHRQSDRDKPKTTFSNGIRKGKLMAKEHTGVLLCMLVVLRSAKGKQIVGRMRKYFGQDKLDDWILLLETLLQWEEWMKSSIIMKKHVHRARHKHRCIMHLIKIVAYRAEGMGLKLTKFHAILHIVDDILNFGVPMEVDTGSNEAGHKPAKTAAKLTQKKKDKFEIQTATRLEEVHLLDLAEEEMRGRPLYDYFEGHIDEAVMAEELDEPPTIDGAACQFFTGTDGKNYCQGDRKIKGRYPDFQLETTFVDWVVGLKDAVAEHVPQLVVHSKLTRREQIFRANVSFQGGVWRDWVWIDWGIGCGHLPNKIWGFVDLSDLPPKFKINYGGLNTADPGYYAIVESTTMIEEENTELVLTVESDVVEDAHGQVQNLQFYLADSEAFVEPAIVVPNIGGKPNGYLATQGRNHWRQKFEDFLDLPHHVHKINEPESEEEVESEESGDEDEEDSVKTDSDVGSREEEMSSDDED